MLGRLLSVVGALGACVLAVAAAAVPAGRPQGEPALYAQRIDEREAVRGVEVRAAVPVKPSAPRNNASPRVRSASEGGPSVHHLGTQFPGITQAAYQERLGTSPAVPNPTLAVGTHHMLQGVEGALSVFSHSGELLGVLSAKSLFTVTADQINFPRRDITQVQAVYVAEEEVWIAVGLDTGPRLTDLLIARSRTADPLGPWDAYLLDAGQLDVLTRDVHLTANGGGVFVGLERVRSSFGTVTVEPDVLFTPVRPYEGSTRWNPVFRLIGGKNWLGGAIPTHVGDASTPEATYLCANAKPQSGSAVEQLMVLKFRHSETWPQLEGATYIGTGRINPPPVVPTLGVGPALDTAGYRIASAALHDGRIWCTRTVGLNAAGLSQNVDRSGVQWLSIDVRGASPVLEQSGMVFDGSANPRHYFQPALAVTPLGNVTLLFSSASEEEPVSLWATGRTAVDAPGTMRQPFLVRQGEGPIPVVAQGDGSTAWGRGASACLDASDGMTVWATAAIPSPTPAGWHTSIHSILGPAPVLNGLGIRVPPGDAEVPLTLSGQHLFSGGDRFPTPFKAEVLGVTRGTIQVQEATVDVAQQRLALQLSVGADALAGRYHLRFTNPDGQSTVLQDVLLVGDGPYVRLEATSLTVSEAEGVAEPGLLYSGTGSTQVGYRTLEGTAKEGSDFEPSEASLDLSQQSPRQSAPITLLQDADLEGTEEFYVQLTAATAASILAPELTRVVVTDDTERPKPTRLFPFWNGSQPAQLHWEDNCTNETGYEIQRQLNGTGSFTTVATLAAGSENYTDVSVLPGNTYAYRVRAVRGELASSFSDAVTAGDSFLHWALERVTGLEATPLHLDIQRQGASERPVGVDYLVLAGTATAGEDFVLQSGRVEIPAGGSASSIPVEIPTDRLLESAESFTVQLASPAGAGLVAPSLMEVVIEDLPASTRPQNLTATALSARSVKLEWQDSCDNESGYQIWRSLPGESKTLLTTTVPNAVSYVDTTAARGTTYAYEVIATLDLVASSSPASATVTTPDWEVNFASASASGLEGGSATLILKRTGTSAAGATVQLSLLSGGTAVAGQDFTPVGAVSFLPGQTELEVAFPLLRDALLEEAESFQLRLTDPDGVDVGAADTATVIIQDDPSATAPSLLRTTAITDTQITLAWTDNCGNESSFAVERAQGNSTFSVVGTAGAGATSFTDMGRAAKTSYSYRVRATAGSLSSDPSAVLTATTAPGKGRIEISKTSLSFGKVKRGKVKSLSFTLTNTGKVPVTVAVTGPASPFGLPLEVLEFTLTPTGAGRKRIILVTFSPTTKGEQKSVVRLTTSARGKEAVKIRLSGKGT